MCGIAGIVVTRPCEGFGRTGDAILRRLQHRGPDDQGWLCHCRGSTRGGKAHPDAGLTEVMLLHRRLSIIDLSDAGHQPMSTADGRYHVVFNGEIYNYMELREELAATGCCFRTQTDTEVLLAAFAQWGMDAFRRFVGMFAFAILDTQERSLVLVRDFFGIKPLFYSYADGRFAFASEIKALLEVPGIGRRVNARAVHAYFTHLIADHCPETFLEDIFQLPPAHYMVIPLDSSIHSQPHPYWGIQLEDQIDISFDEAKGRVRDLLFKSVQLHLRSDVSVGACLSGGIDSSSIVMAVRAVAGTTSDLHSFSFVAPGSAVDEERWVDIVGSAADARVHKVQIASEELIADLDTLITIHDEPFGGTSIYAQYRVCQLAHEMDVKVLLDGQGADELFAGYPFYVGGRIVSLLQSGRPAEAIQLLYSAQRRPGLNTRSLLTHVRSWALPDWIKKFARQVRRRQAIPNWLDYDWFKRQGVVLNGPTANELWGFSLRSQLYNGTVRLSLPELLRNEDRNSMAFSIESRVPFLTPELAEFVFRLPESYLIGPDGTTKRILREAMRGIVPDAVLDRKDKIGFATPELTWMRVLRPWVEKVLSSPTAKDIPAFRHAAILQETQKMLSGAQPVDWRLWRWVNLVRWTDLLGIEWSAV